MKPYTAEERERLSETLKKPLGPEYISYRVGPAGKQSYLNGGLAIQLANDIFGFDGWSSEIKDTTIDYVDVDENRRANVGVSVTMRITLKDGTYREDVGYASSQNAPNKGIAIDKARKAATTDAMKRTLKNFGNALGNCLYDKSYLQGVAQMANPQIKFSPANLYRHEQFKPKDVTPQLALQQAYQQRKHAPTISPPTNPQAPPQARQMQSRPQASYPRVPSTLIPPQQIKAQASTPTLQQQQQSIARKRHQEQMDMQQKRAKQDNHHEPIAKPEVVAATTTTTTTSTSGALPVLLPEDSFSYEGDAEFFAMFGTDAEDEFTIKEDEFVKIDEAVTASSSPSSSSSTIAAEASVGVRR